MHLKILKHFSLTRLFSFLVLIAIGIVGVKATEYETVYGERNVYRTIQDIFDNKEYTKVPKETLVSFKDTVIGYDGILWKRKMPINYYITGNGKANYTEFISKHFKLAELVTGISSSATNNPTYADFIISLGAYDVNLREKEDNVKVFEFAKDKCKLMVIAEHDEITEVGFIINPGTDNAELNDCFWKLFYRSFGVFGQSSNKNSVFNEYNNSYATNLPETDHLTLRMLYSPFFDKGALRDEISRDMPNKFYVESITQRQYEAIN